MTRTYDTPTLNTMLIFDLIRWAEFEDDEEARLAAFPNWGQWDQGSWGKAPGDLLPELNDPVQHRNGVCRTAYCMAGQAVVEADYRLIYTTNHSATAARTGGLVLADDCVRQRYTGVKDEQGRQIWEDVPDAPHEPIPEVGARVLGLDDTEAAAFFEAGNDVETLKMMANWFCNDRSLPLLFPDHDIYVPYPDDDDDDY